MENLSSYFPWVFNKVSIPFFLFGGDFAHVHVDNSIRSSNYCFLVLIAFKEEFYELIDDAEDGPKPAENEGTAAEIETSEIEEKQK